MMNIVKEYIPAGRANRPGKGLVAKYITIHDTGNSDTGADAKNHSHWVRTNPDPGFLSSWHFTVDDKIIIQQLPLDEHGWHAGDGINGTGNRQSIGIEICENKDGQRKLAEKNAAWLCSKLIQEVSTLLAFPDCMRQHYHWTGKNCPRVIRGRPGGWEEFLRQVSGFLKTGGETAVLQKAIVLGSYVDFVLAEPLARHLNAPIFLREALGRLKAEEIYIAGGGTEGISGGKIINLSGANRYETAQNIYAFLQKK